MNNRQSNFIRSAAANALSERLPPNYGCTVNDFINTTDLSRAYFYKIRTHLLSLGHLRDPRSSTVPNDMICAYLRGDMEILRRNYPADDNSPNALISDFYLARANAIDAIRRMAASYTRLRQATDDAGAYFPIRAQYDRHIHEGRINRDVVDALLDLLGDGTRPFRL